MFKINKKIIFLKYIMKKIFSIDFLCFCTYISILNDIDECILWTIEQENEMLTKQ